MSTVPASRGSANVLPEIPTGCPESARVQVELRVLVTTPKAVKVEAVERGNGSAWLPRSVVGIGSAGTRYGCEIYHVPVWLWRKVRRQLV